MMKRPVFLTCLVLSVIITTAVLLLPWIALIIPLPVALLMLVPFVVVLLTVVAAGFQKLAGLVGDVSRGRLFVVLAIAAPIIGVGVGVAAYIHNSYQVPYLIWYPLGVTVGLEALLGLGGAILGRSRD